MFTNVGAVIAVAFSTLVYAIVAGALGAATGGSEFFGVVFATAVGTSSFAVVAALLVVNTVTGKFLLSSRYLREFPEERLREKITCALAFFFARVYTASPVLSMLLLYGLMIACVGVVAAALGLVADWQLGFSHSIIWHLKVIVSAIAGGFSVWLVAAIGDLLRLADQWTPFDPDKMPFSRV